MTTFPIRTLLAASCLVFSGAALAQAMPKANLNVVGNLAVNGLSLTPWQRVTAVRVCVLVRTVGGNTRIADKTGAARTYKNCQDADTAQPARDTITRYVQVFGLRNGLKQYY